MGERAFGAAVRPRQLTFDVDGSDAEPGPFVYLACRLTSLDAEHRKLLDSWCTHIQHAVTEAVDDSGDPWRVAVHTPLSWSAPRTDDGRTPQGIYALYSAKVAECAALIVLATNGGGLGVGQELAWATSLRLPILVLHHTDEPPSRQVVGTPADITIVAFTDATHLTEAVKEFVRRNRSTIADLERRRESLMTVLIPLRENLAEAWAGLSDHERSGVEAESRLHRDRVTHMLSDTATGSSTTRRNASATTWRRPCSFPATGSVRISHRPRTVWPQSGNLRRRRRPLLAPASCA